MSVIIGFHLVFLSGIAAPIVKATFWRWWRSRLGLSIASKTLALSAVLLPVEVNYWFHQVMPEWFTSVTLYLVVAIIWWRVYEIYRVQRTGGHGDGPV